jgi:hypothetical protein
MYILMERLVIAGLVLILGAVLFLAVTAVLLVVAVVRAAALRTIRFFSSETTGLGEKLDGSPLAHTLGHGD